jgi:hypothetical protein
MPGAGYAWAVALRGDYAYVAAESEGMQIVNVSSPTNPSPVGGGFRPAGASVWGLAVEGNYAYLAAGLGGVRVVNIQPGSSVRVAVIPTGDRPRRSPWRADTRTSPTSTAGCASRCRDAGQSCGGHYVYRAIGRRAECDRQRPARPGDDWKTQCTCWTSRFPPALSCAPHETAGTPQDVAVGNGSW